MIVKGKPRSGPEQLAAYLLRVDDGEHPTLVELFDGGEDLRKAFVQWHAIGELTRGEKTLYHAQIAPEARYKMTPEQYLRGAEILAEELGMADHPRAVVIHDGGDKPHAHVVFQRADSDTLTLWDDSYNYVKHERASLRMELEFGHEHVPGKHAKRDREKQPEFPRSEASQDDHQQADRTELTLQQRKAQITTLRSECDNAQAFKAALEEAGYILAKGDKRGIVLVDEQGEVYSLSKHVTDIKGKEYKAFMAAIDVATLPAVEDAKAQQLAGKTDTLEEAQKQGVEASKFFEAQKKQGVEASKFFEAQPPAKVEPPAPAPEDPEITAIKKALAERQAKDLKFWDDYHAHEVRMLDHNLGILYAEKGADFDVMQTQKRDALKAAHQEKRSGIQGFIDAIQSRWNPELAAEKTRQQRREVGQLQRRLEQERKDYLALLEQSKQMELDNLKERQALKRGDVEQAHEQEEERYIREQVEAKRILAEMKAREKELEHNDSLREGPPPPEMGK